MKERAAAAGRDPDTVLIMPGLPGAIADTDEEAWADEERTLQAKDFTKTLAEFGRPFGWHDFSQYDLDAPFPDVAQYGASSFRTQAERIVAVARERGLTPARDRPVRRTHAPHAVRRLAADGRRRDRALVRRPRRRRLHPDDHRAERARPLHRRGAADPARARAVPHGVRGDTLRGNLGLPIPENVHTVARQAAREPAYVTR